MKKLLFLTVPLLMASVMALTDKGADANYADNEGPLILQDGNLQEDENKQDILNQKGNFSNQIGRGLNVADVSPLAFQNWNKHTEHIFKTNFLDELFIYGDYVPSTYTDFQSSLEYSASSISTSVSTTSYVSAGVQASYACVTAKVSAEVGFGLEFSNEMSGSVAIFNFNWMSHKYGYYLPQFDTHKTLYKNHLTENFKSDLSSALRANNQSRYEQLFEKYGSHVVMSGFYGGASTVYGSLISSELKTSTATTEYVKGEVALGFEANGYGAEVSAGSGNSMTQEFGLSTANSIEKYSAKFYGGNPVAGATTLETILSNAREWTPTVHTNPVLVQYDSVIPIWWLLTGDQDTATNAYNLERAFEIYRAERENYYLSLAYQVNFTDSLRYTHSATNAGEVVKVQNSNSTSYKKQINLTTLSDNYNLSYLEKLGFNQARLAIKFSAKAARNAVKKIKVKVVLGGKDFGFGYDYTLDKDPAEQYKEITYGLSYTRELADILYDNSTLSVEIRSSGAVEMKDIKFELIYSKPNENGSGTASDPYMIYNVYQFRDIQNDMNAHYKLAYDIFFDSVPYWQPIPGVFNGTLDGDGYSLKNINIRKVVTSSGSTTNVGIFETVGPNGKIDNVTLSECTLTVESNASSTPTVNAGLFAGKLDGGKIVSCTIDYSEVSVKTYPSYAGMVVGYSTGTVSYTYVNSVSIYGKSTVGGIVGTLHINGVINKCQVKKSGSNKTRIELNAGSSGSNYRAGGLAGYVYKGTITDSKVEYTNFYLTGDTSRSPAIGTYVGFLSNGTIQYKTTGSNNSRNTVNSSYKTYYFANNSGLCGKNTNGTVTKV